MDDLDSVQQSMLLLVGASPKGIIDSEMRIQKLAFLFSKSLGDPDLDGDFDFEPYDLGPYSENLAGAIEMLGVQGLLTKDPQRNKYQVTGTGSAAANEVASRDPARSEIAKEIVRCLGSLDPNDLAAAVYELYPEYTTRSVIIDRLRARSGVDSLIIPLEKLETNKKSIITSRRGRQMVVSSSKSEIQIEEKESK